MIRRHQTGIALITVLLILALATVAAVSMTSRQQLDIRRTSNILKIEEGYMALLAAEEFAKRVLIWDFREIPKINSRVNTITDGHGDIWKSPFLDSAKQTLGNFEVVNFKFVDLQGRFNLNNLIDANQNPSQADLAAFQRLLHEKGLPDSLANVAVDWIDANTDTYQSGAEDTAYQTLKQPYVPPNKPMASASEMNRLMTVNLAGEEDYDKSSKTRRKYIRDMLHKEDNQVLTALPKRTEINVNSAASPAIFQMLVPGLEYDKAETMFNEIRVGPGQEPLFQNANDFWNYPAVKAVGIKQDKRMPITFSSEYFLFSAEAISGDLVVYCNTIFHRTGGTSPSVEVVHRSYGKKGEI